MKKFILFVIYLLPLLSFAQQDNIWYFGHKAGLDFSSGAPVPLLDGQMVADEACASIADTNGQLLFYTNGNKVWNRNHAIMLNGNGLFGHISSTQTLIVPHPGNPQLYYIFTVDQYDDSKGLRFSIVDITGDNGLGQVTTKNTPMVAPVTEKVTGAWHANGIDIWIVTHGRDNNAFYTFKLTPEGIEGPVISATGSFTGEGALSQGSMKISTQGNWLAISNNTLNTQLFNFDNTTGTVSNPLTLNDEGGYGIEFSPSGNFLYITTNNAVLQYNLTADNIPGSAAVITNQSALGALQIGPDQKIYMANMWPLLSVINNPDEAGAACHIEMSSVDLGWREAWFGLPAFLPSRFSIYNTQIQNLCLGDTTLFSFDSTVEQPDSLLWDFGDGTSSDELESQHIFAAPGIYTVKLTVLWLGQQRSIEHEIIISPVPVAHTAPDMILCDEGDDQTELFDLIQQDAPILGVQSAAAHLITYHLTSLDAEAGTNPLDEHYSNTSNPQVIFARIMDTETGCSSFSSFELSVVLKPVLAMQDQYSMCGKEPIEITAPAGFADYQWSSGETGRMIVVDQPGEYSVTVFQNTNGVICSSTMDITVSDAGLPVIKNIEVDDWHETQNSIIISTLNQGVFDYSIDGIHFQDSNIFTGLLPGLYTLYVRNSCGITAEKVTVLTYPKFFTPNEDGINDVWRIPYSYFEPDMVVAIFDRYGKLIISFTGSDQGWDGKYNGNVLPSTDYWFIAHRADGEAYKGHFAMIR